MRLLDKQKRFDETPKMAAISTNVKGAVSEGTFKGISLCTASQPASQPASQQASLCSAVQCIPSISIPDRTALCTASRAGVLVSGRMRDSAWHAARISIATTISAFPTTCSAWTSTHNDWLRPLYRVCHRNFETE
jgi:hypothetical protein